MYKYSNALQNYIVSVIDKYCRNCSAYKKVNLSVDGLCHICVNRKVCSVCHHRRQDRFFTNGGDTCTTCERRQASPQIRTSVQHVFREEDLDVQSNARDVSLLIRGLEGTIADRLEQGLREYGYVYNFNRYFLEVWYRSVFINLL